MNRIQLQPVYILHRRPYRNTSLMVDLFTSAYGRISAIARSARGPKSRYRGKLEPFSYMLANWSGRNELKTLGDVELEGSLLHLSGQRLSCGFYLNELLMRLLHRDDPYPDLFHIYHQTLQHLDGGDDIQITLRCFEKHLLQELGYGLPLQYEAQTGLPIDPERFYRFLPEQGFLIVEKVAEDKHIFSGLCLLALHHEKDFCAPVLKELKRLLRLALSQYLGDRPIKSRELLFS